MRLLLVGGGSIGERHMRCFRRARPGIHLEICEPRAARRRDLARRYDLAAAHADFGKIDLARFDAAVVATPANLHVPQARRLLKAGCHVLVEKPLTVPGHSIGKFLREEKKGGRVVGVAYTYRSYSQLIEMANEVRANRVGKPFLARVRLAYDYPRYRPDYRRNYFAQENTGGGVILDIASHALAYLTWVLGPVDEVQAAAGRLGLPGVSVLDTALIILRFRSGVLAEIWTSACQPRRETEFEILGKRGHLRWANLFDGRSELAYTPGDGKPWKVKHRHFDPDAPFVSQARNFLAAIAGRERIRTTLAEGIYINKLCSAALRSHLKGRRVRVDEG